MVKRNAGRGRSTTRSQNKAVSDPVEQRSPNDRSFGGYDPEDYHAEGPVPLEVNDVGSVFLVQTVDQRGMYDRPFREFVARVNGNK